MSKLPKYAIPVLVGLVLAAIALLWVERTAAVAGIATILLTAILVSITWYYADETRAMRQEAQMSRLFSLPVLRLTATLTTEPNVVVRNIGQGFAMDVEMTILETEVDKEPVEGSLRIPILGPGEGIELKPRSFPVQCINGFELADRSITFRAQGTYVDAAGFHHTLDDTFSLSDYITQCELRGVEFASVSREQRDLHKETEEREFRKSVPESLKTIAKAISHPWSSAPHI